MENINRLVLNCFLKILACYQLAVSPFLGHCCRFSPSCSEYMRQALETYGFFQGLYLGFKRLLCCHPWCEGGLDPVPERTKHVDKYA